MSLKAVVWAQDHAPVGSSTDAAVLVALARSADEEGRGAYPSVDTIMWRTRFKERAVRESLARMKKSGVIGLGDQNLVDHLSPDDRPVVWDLDMSKRRPERPPKTRSRRGRGASGAPRGKDGVQDVHPAQGDGVHVVHERGACGAATGCATCTQRREEREDQGDNQAAAGGSDDQSSGGEVHPDARKILAGCGRHPDDRAWARAAADALARGGRPLDIIGHVMAPITRNRNGDPIRNPDAIRLERLRSWTGKPSQEPPEAVWDSIRTEHPRPHPAAGTAHLCPEHGTTSRYLSTGACEQCLLRDHPELAEPEPATQATGLPTSTETAAAVAQLKRTLPRR